MNTKSREWNIRVRAAKEGLQAKKELKSSKIIIFTDTHKRKPDLVREQNFEQRILHLDIGERSDRKGVKIVVNSLTNYFPYSG